MTFVNEVSRFAESVSARCQIERGGNGDKPPDLRGRRIRQFAGHLQHKVAAHRKSDGENLRQLIALDQFEYHRTNVAAQARMIERSRETFSAAAVSLVQPNDIESGRPGLLRDPQHVARVRRAFEPMQKNDRRTFAWIFMQVTIGPNLCS